MTNGCYLIGQSLMIVGTHPSPTMARLGMMRSWQRSLQPASLQAKKFPAQCLEALPGAALQPTTNTSFPDFFLRLFLSFSCHPETVLLFNRSFTRYPTPPFPTQTLNTSSTTAKMPFSAGRSLAAPARFRFFDHTRASSSSRPPARLPPAIGTPYVARGYRQRLASR